MISNSSHCRKLIFQPLAKAKQREKDATKVASASYSDARNQSNKRPLAVIPADSASPTGARSAPKPLKRDSRLGSYFEYDLSKMINSKGGFLVEDEKEADEKLRAIEKERERERAMQNFDPREFTSFGLDMHALILPQQCFWMQT